MKKLILFIVCLFLSLDIYAYIEWEKVPQSFNNSYLYRAKVPHGWIINFETPTRLSITFYPDEKHEWKINNE